MDNLRTYHKYGERKKGTSNKYYEVEAIEIKNGRATWAFRWARIGGICARPKEGEVHSFDYARLICQEQWRKKSLKYTEVSAMEALASAAQEIRERPNRGLPKVEFDIPRFHAGKSEKRCKEFCAKYLAKLNIVRASRYEMDYDEYEKQIETILKQYCAEWSRIIQTKAHGALEDNTSAHTAFCVFFSLLKDDAGCTIYGYYEGVGTSNF